MQPVFGLDLDKAVAATRVRDGYALPAVVYRCLEFLDYRGAPAEEGIFRHSGSSNVVRALQQKFNSERDYNILASGNVHDIHAVSGLLKHYLRELPTNLLTEELAPGF
ncbi:Rho GTPase activation protein, partial [Ramicandelaber brevisporus]